MKAGWIVFGLIVCLFSNLWAEVLVTQEAELGYTGTVSVKPRSNASNDHTVLENVTGGTVSWSISFPCSTSYSLVVRYSNDNDGVVFDDVSVWVDGVKKDEFTSVDTREVGGVPGSGWNVFVNSPALDLGALSEGDHEIALKLESQDGYGIEFDMLTFSGVCPVLQPPDLEQPEAGAADVPLDPTPFCWEASEGADRYWLQVSPNEDMSDLVFINKNITDICYEVNVLEAETKYYWRVKAYNGELESDWSGKWSFTTQGNPPSAPELLSPANGAANVPIDPTLSWQASEGAETYCLQVSTHSDMSNPIVDNDNISATGLQVIYLSEETTYYWRVNASNPNGTGEWSTIWSFETVTSEPWNYSQEAELGYTGTVTEKPRSNASNLKTIWENETGGTVSWTISFPCSTSYSLVVRYSNDNDGVVFDVVSVWVDGVKKDEFTSVDTRIPGEAAGTGWNEFVNSPTLDLGTISGGSHEIALKLESQDNYGIEYDMLTFSGICTIIENIKDNEGAVQSADSWQVLNCYPNPFNPSTRIQCHVAEGPAHVSLSIYNVYGQRVYTLVDEKLQWGSHEFVWNGTNEAMQPVASGIYFARVAIDGKAGVKLYTMKMMLMK